MFLANPWKSSRLLKSLDDYNSLLSKNSRLGEIPCFFLMVFPWTSRDKCGHITYHQSLSDQDKISLKQPLKNRDQQDYHIFRLGNPNLNLYLPVTGSGATPKSYPFHPILVFLVGSMIMCLGSCFPDFLRYISSGQIKIFHQPRFP